MTAIVFFRDEDGSVPFLSHGITKQETAVPGTEIERARRRRLAFEADPRRYTHKEAP